MKRIYQSFLLVAGILALVELPGCKKGVDCKPIEELKLCNIKRMVIYKSYYNDTARFTYNAVGNPTKVTVTNVATGNPNYVFKYDAAGRLTDFIGVYDNGNTENWVRYTYGASGRVITDTTFTFGLYNGGAFPSNYWGHRINHYTYDALGRVSRIDTDVILPSPGPGGTTFYNYDAAGNLIRPGTVYDSKINFHRTNSIFQFVDKDYSNNNPITAISYNPFLPLSFRAPVTHPYYFLGSLIINQSDFTYSCDLGGVKVPKDFKID